VDWAAGGLVGRQHWRRRGWRGRGKGVRATAWQAQASEEVEAWTEAAAKWRAAGAFAGGIDGSGNGSGESGGGTSGGGGGDGEGRGGGLRAGELGGGCPEMVASAVVGTDRGRAEVALPSPGAAASAHPRQRPLRPTSTGFQAAATNLARAAIHSSPGSAHILQDRRARRTLRRRERLISRRELSASAL
jgi:hypothetical protein